MSAELIGFFSWFFKTRPVSPGGPESKICFGPGLTENHSKTTTWMKETREISPSIININQNCPLWDDMPQHLCKNLCQDHSMKKEVFGPSINSMKASRRSRMPSSNASLLNIIGCCFGQEISPPQKKLICISVCIYIYVCIIYHI